MPFFTSGKRATKAGAAPSSASARCARAPSRSSPARRAAASSSSDVDELFAELAAQDVLHPVSAGGPDDTDFGSREFAAVDLDGNLITFFLWRSEA